MKISWRVEQSSVELMLQKEYFQFAVLPFALIISNQSKGKINEPLLLSTQM